MKLTIVKKKNAEYSLRDEKGKDYSFIFEFYDVEKLPNVGDTIEISEKLLDEKAEDNSKMFAFGALTSAYGRKIDTFQDDDCIMLKTGDKEIFLKRLYG